MLLNKIRYLVWHAWMLIDYSVSASLLRLKTKDPVRLRQLRLANNQRVTARFLKAFRVTLKVNGRERLEAMRDSAYLLIANHSTYLDVVLLAALERLVFITSEEMGKNPFLGDLTRLGGCLYTNRKKKVTLPGEIARFTETIRQGFKVVLFPEGTSTDGSSIKAFRKSLFEVAVRAQCPVVPVCIRYLSIDGQPVGPANRDLVAWYGDMSFLPHHLKILGHSMLVELTVLEPVAFDPQRGRGELSDLVYQRLLETFHAYDQTIPSP